MSDAASFVEEAQTWAKSLVRAECRFPGDYADAIRRVARRAKVTHGFLWTLHYRSPKTITVDQYAKLAGAYANAQQNYRDERRGYEAKTWLGKALLRVADRLGSEEDGAVIR